MRFPSWPLRSPRARSAPKARPRDNLLSRPRLERLECRLAPATSTWTGLAGDGLWGSAGNWTNGVPGSGDTALFSGTTGGTIQVNGTFAVGALSFTNTAGSFLLQPQAAGDSLSL